MTKTRIAYATCSHIDLNKMPDTAKVFGVPTEGGPVTMVWCADCARQAALGFSLKDTRFYFNQRPLINPEATVEALKREFWESLIRIAMSKEFEQKARKN